MWNCQCVCAGRFATATIAAARFARAATDCSPHSPLARILVQTSKILLEHPLSLSGQLRLPSLLSSQLSARAEAAERIFLTRCLPAGL